MMPLKALITGSQLALGALLLCAAPWVTAAEEDSQLSRDLKLEAFPALQASEDSLRLLDVNHEHTLLSSGFNLSPGSQGLDLSTSYTWESTRFGQFVVSTNTSYIYNTAIADSVRESVALLPRTEPAIGLMPERQSSVTFSWQIGNHTATAVTSYTDTMDQLGLFSLDALNVDDLNELVGQITTLDLRYAYNVRAGRTGNASIALGVRNMFERKAQASSFVNTSGAAQPGSVAYGTIKYQF
ncbi:MAG: hypothetical protein Q7W55_04345 [Pseudohongiella sp.]|nr:hypothetical protein [Pseudohongiella sp.]MDO9521934.1 hypothetical protein [Pseudohongiella sp.]MDP2128569.1 hypothetical protein [Pseudohongiella sp.]